MTSSTLGLTRNRGMQAKTGIELPSSPIATCPIPKSIMHLLLEAFVRIKLENLLQPVSFRHRHSMQTSSVSLSGPFEGQ